MKGQFVVGAAKALYHLGGTKEETEARQQALDEVVKLIEASQNLENFLNTPFIALNKRMEVLSELVQKMPNEIKNLIALALSKRKAHLIPGIAKAYKQLHENKLEVEVISTTPLTANEKAAISQKLELAAKKPIQLIETIDPDLLGGFKLIFSNKMLDMSVAGASNDLKQYILR